MIIGSGNGLVFIWHQVIVWTSIEKIATDVSYSCSALCSSLSAYMMYLPRNTCWLWLWHAYPLFNLYYRQTSNISRTLVANKIVDHSDVVRDARRCCSNYILILDLTPGFNGLGKDNYKTRREPFKFGFGASCIRGLTVPFKRLYCRTMQLSICSLGYDVPVERCHVTPPNNEITRIPDGRVSAVYEMYHIFNRGLSWACPK